EVGGNIQALQHLASDPLTFAADPWHVAVSLLTFADDAQQDMLGTDGVVFEALGFFLRQNDHSPRPFCKLLKHRSAPRRRLEGGLCKLHVSENLQTTEFVLLCATLLCQEQGRSRSLRENTCR